MSSSSSSLTEKNPTISSSLSSIDRLFDPEEIREIVISLVFERFKFKEKHRKNYNKQELISSINNDDSHISSFNCTQFLHDALGSNYKIFDSTPSKESSSVRTSNILSLISPDYSLGTDTSSISTSSPLHQNVKNHYTILESTNYKKKQVLKAIYYDSFSKKRKVLSEERIEAEKLLLLLDIERYICSEMVDSGLKSLSSESNLIQSCTATVTLSHIRFMLRDLQSVSTRFLCVVTYGTNVLASELTSAKGNNFIQVTNKFMITSMKRQDTIRINLYSIKKTQKKIIWLPSVCTQQRTDSNNFEIPERPSLFQVCARSCLTIADLMKLNLYRNRSLEIESGWLAADVNISLNLSVYETKFINICKNPKSHPIWNLQWCVLNNTVLKYYNYPSDPIAIEEIDLELCSVKRLSETAKKTLLLATHKGDNYLFSFNTDYECELWKNSFNYIISNLKLWKI